MRQRFPGATTYVGVDIQAGADVDVVADIHRLSETITPCSVDAIICLSTLEHLKYPTVAAHEILKCLKIGGEFFVQTHQTFALQSDQHDYYRFSKEALSGLFSAAMGAEVIGALHEFPVRILSEIGESGPAFLNACIAGRKIAATPDHYVYELPEVVAVQPPALPPEVPPTVRTLLAYGVQRQRQGDLDAASTAYGAVLNIDEENADALHLLGLIAHGRGEPEAALALIERALRRAETARFHANRAMVLNVLKRPAEAEAACRQAIELDGSHADALNTWGLLRLAQGDHARSIEMLRRALKLRPSYPEAAFNLGRALAQAEQLTEAEAAYRASFALRPGLVGAGASARRVLYIYVDAEQPGRFYRCMRLAEAAREAGWQAEAKALAEVRDADLVGLAVLVLWRMEYSPESCRLVALARAGGAKVGLDLDDLVIDPMLARADVIDGIRSLGITEEAVRMHFVKVQRMLLNVDFGSCTTDELALHMRRSGRPVFVIRNGFDAATRELSAIAAREWRRTRPDALIRIGYAAGTRTHQQDMIAAGAAIADALQARPDARLVLFQKSGDGERLVDPAELRELGAVVDQIEWRSQVPLAGLPSELARFDINIAPLEAGNPFVEAKSELKYFEAALVGVPTVASPTGPFRRAIREGETGLLAGDPKAWRDALALLLHNAPLRRAIGTAARRDAVKRFGPLALRQEVDRMLRALASPIAKNIEGKNIDSDL